MKTLEYAKKFGIDGYLVVLLATVGLSFVLPARETFADFVKQAAYFAVALLFLYMARN
ncbi:hypothetical protein [Devosia yakushimensis]|uniref:hypothetical protein n=1 Tax=Devosia yakushimensis TaxID=470028 RepID=UPI0024E16781|nr:hypothetical protein [Devosia yakushimensis]